MVYARPGVDPRFCDGTRWARGMDADGEVWLSIAPVLKDLHPFLTRDNPTVFVFAGVPLVSAQYLWTVMPSKVRFVLEQVVAETKRAFTDSPDAEILTEPPCPLDGWHPWSEPPPGGGLN
jgi:hypothetical protein